MAKSKSKKLEAAETPDKWIQNAIKEPGAFTRKAVAADMSVPAFAAEVTAPDSKASPKTKRQGNLAKVLSKMSKGRKKKAKVKKKGG